MTDKTAKKANCLQKKVKYLSNIDKITNLPNTEKLKLGQVAEKYPFFANDYYLNLIDWNDPHDPIRRIIIPDYDELQDWGHLDASNEKSNTVVPGVQHKYASTALFLVNENCGGLCRYCFRKRLFISENREVIDNISIGLEYIKDHPEINNVLVTGGDPLMLPTKRLTEIVARLREIDHIKIIRIGSKMPAYNPFRILDDLQLLKMFRKYSTRDKRLYMMCHFDHPNELTDHSLEAIFQIQKAGVICANQNPILKGISDKPEVMMELWNRLAYIGVPQYYVFQGRPTAGNKPFMVPIVEAYNNIEKAKLNCSGLAKRIRYVMSHESGKVEVVGVDESNIYLKYHRAKYSRNDGRFFICKRNNNAYWLDQLKPVDKLHHTFGRYNSINLLTITPSKSNKTKVQALFNNLNLPYE